MRRYNIVSRIILIPTVITFVLAAPVITVLGKRTLDEDLSVLWDGWWHYENVLGEPAPPPIVWGNRNPAAVLHLQEPAPPPNVPPPNPAEVHVPEVHEPPPNLEEVHVPPQGPAYSDSESMELDDDAPPSSPGSSTESDSNSDHSPTISNAPSVESRSENLNATDSELKGKAKVSRRISGAADGVDTVHAAQMELRSAVDPGP
jgi:hypothetical protein